MSGDPRVLLTTAPSDEVAGAIARALVGEGLAACVNLLPGVRSVYSWQGRIAEDQEIQLIVKTSAERVDAILDRLTTLHPYDVPEALVLPIVGGSNAYLDWLSEAVAGRT